MVTGQHGGDTRGDRPEASNEGQRPLNEQRQLCQQTTLGKLTMRKGGIGHSPMPPEKLTPSELVISVSKVKAQNALKKSVNMHNFLQWILRHSDSTKIQPSSQQSNYEERKKEKKDREICL